MEDFLNSQVKKSELRTLRKLELKSLALLQAQRCQFTHDHHHHQDQLDEMFAIPFFVDELLGSSTNAHRQKSKGKPAIVDSTSPSFQFDVSALESLSAAITRLKSASGVLPPDELWHRVELE